tara:strand:- start:1696 stop:2088 length:393 start_codon:yes stop_codon:yes gene_type:complete
MNNKYITQNNIHNNFPGLMSDGRIYTNYNINKNINKLNKNIKNNQDLRYYMIHNSENIKNINKMHYKNDMNTYASKHVLIDRNQMSENPYLFHSVYDDVQPYGYETNFTKNKYLSRVELSERKKNKYKKI